MSDLVLSHAMVLDPAAGRLVPDVHVVVEGGRIADVAARAPRSPKGRVIDVRMVQDGPVAEFRILGPLEVLAAGRPLTITAPVQRRLLVALLLRANRTVPADVLVEELWPRDPPAKVEVALRMTVLRIRRAAS